MSVVRLAVDATNLVHDRRGMGRVARAVLAVLRDDPAFHLTLLSERRAERALRTQFPGTAILVRRAFSHVPCFDAAWYPFNGIRTTVKARTVVTVHDAFAFTDPARGRVARAREQRPILRAAQTADLIVTVSAFSRAEIVRALRVSPDRIVVLSPNPDDFFRPGGSEALPPSLADRPYVLVLGAPEPRKNLALFFEAAAAALRGRPELLAIVGSLAPADAARLRTLGLPHLRIDADDAQLRALYRSAAFVAVPSRAEGFGMVAAEAMACGAAVLAADAGALPETVGRAGLTIDPRDVRAWTQAMRGVLEDASFAGALRAFGAARYNFAPRTAYARGMRNLLLAVGSDAR